MKLNKISYLCLVLLCLILLPAGSRQARAAPLQQDSPDCGDLHQQGMALSDQSRYAEALEQYQAALDCYRAAGDRTGEGRVLNNIGTIYSDQGRYDEALEAYEQALTISREVGDRAGEGAALSNIGVVYQEWGRYDEALNAFQQALPIFGKIDDRAGEGAALGNIGRVYYLQGRYDEALNAFQQALPIFGKIDDRAGEGTTLDNIGAVYSDQGRYAEALEAYQQALAISREVGDRAGEGNALNDIGGVYRRQGRYAEALEAYQQALAIRREIGDRAGEGDTLHNIGVVYDAQGRYAEALEKLQQALAISHELNDRAGEGYTLANIGAVYNDQGRYAEALEKLQQALAIFREVGDRAGEGQTLTGIGNTYDNQGRYDEALEAYQQALTIFREIGDRAGEGQTLTGIGNTYDNQGRYDEALEAYQQALTISGEVGDRAGEGGALNNIGIVHKNQGRYDEALEKFQQALAISRELGDQVEEGHTLGNIGTVYADQGQVDQALEAYQEAMDIVEATRATAGSEEGRAGFIAQYADLYSRAAGLFHQQGQNEEAFLTAERGRARAFLDSLATGQVQLSDEAAADLLRQEQEAYAQRQSAQDALAKARTLTPPDPNLVVDLETQLAEAEKTHAQALAALEAQSQQLAGLVPGRGAKNILGVSQVQALLDQQTTLLSYFVLEEQTLVFLLSRNQFEVVELPVSREELTNRVSYYRKILPFQKLEDTHATAQKMYELLIAPLGGRLETPRLLIIPHGALHYLPFAALLNPQTDHYLLQDHSLVMLPSASALQFITSTDAEQGSGGAGEQGGDSASPLIIGNPTPGDFDATASLTTERAGLNPLPFAQKEAETIAQLYSVKPLLGKAATEGTVRAQASQAGLLHLAAHGYYNPTAPLSSLIALAPDDAYDGWLTVGEVYGLDLRQTDLVVLSACQSQVGELSEGDELVGLTRAFLFAGTPTVVASLWNVDDRATGLLMERFYTHLQAGEGKAEALRQAQLELLAEYPDPYYWAAFVMSGKGGAISETSLSGLAAGGTVEPSAERYNPIAVIGLGLLGGSVLLCLGGGGVVVGGLVWWLWRQKRLEKNHEND